MAKVIDITDKLNFEDGYRIKIKGKEFALNGDAPTMLKIMGVMSGATGPSEVIQAYELLFPEDSRKALDKLKLSIGDLMTVIQEAVSLIAGEIGDTQQ